MHDISQSDEAHDFYMRNVFPRIPYEQKQRLFSRYADIALQPASGFVSLSDVPMFILVALTGTGKTTTLDALDAIGQATYRTDIPTRRELADLMIIPTAQVLSGEQVRPVSDRIERFRLTRTFAQLMGAGGFAMAYGWLQYAWDGMTPVISDGIRGANEIAYTLRTHPTWHVIELWVDPVTRLLRLSQRDDGFDECSEADDVSFLPAEYHDIVRHEIAQGHISKKALGIIQAEAKNYELRPHRARNHHYHLLETATMPPHTVAHEVASIMRGQHA